jgi:hypothetical protein
LCAATSRGASTAESQATLAKYMFYFALENADCGGYVTEKVWEVLSRGSIPVYYGSDDIYKYLPDPDAIVDVKKFKTLDELAARMRRISDDPREFARMRAWRVADPKGWPEGFTRFLGTGHTDVRARVCGVLRAGGNKNRGGGGGVGVGGGGGAAGGAAGGDVGVASGVVKAAGTAGVAGAETEEGASASEEGAEKPPMLPRCAAKPLLGVSVPAYFDAPPDAGQVVLPRRWPNRPPGRRGEDGAVAEEVVQTHG